MSVQASSECWGNMEGLTPAQMVVLLAIADVVNDMHENQFWASSSSLARKVGMDSGNVRHRLQELTGLGWITVLTERAGRPTRYEWMGARRRNAGARREHTPPASTAHTPVLSIQTQDEPKRNAIARADVDVWFDQFWSVYPRRVGKRAARKAFDPALKRGLPDQIIAGAMTYARACERVDEARYIAHPATRLNGDRWLDEPDRDPHLSMLQSMLTDGSEPQELNP